MQVHKLFSSTLVMFCILYVTSSNKGGVYRRYYRLCAKQVDNPRCLFPGVEIMEYLEAYRVEVTPEEAEAFTQEQGPALADKGELYPQAVSFSP